MAESYFARAIHILRYPEAMAQDPGPDEDRLDDPFADVDTSHDLDVVTLFRSSNVDAEMEAMNIRQMLAAEGIPSLLVDPSPIPTLGFEVRVPRSRLADAERVLQDARTAGPAAAAAAEEESEDIH
jgi:hypothetical protein